GALPGRAAHAGGQPLRGSPAHYEGRRQDESRHRVGDRLRHKRGARPRGGGMKTTLLDDIYALRERIDGFPAPNHPAVRPLLDRYEELVNQARNLGYLTETEAMKL